MKTLSDDFEAHLKSGVTTLATCWILRRTDGCALGFTDHDKTLELQGISCEPASGLTGSEIRQSDGFASDDQDISGILTSDRISEADLMSGRYDAAVIETWRVNWQVPEQAIMLRTGYLGEIKRDSQSFQAEIRSLSVELEQERGRIYQYGCDASLGDARCGIDLSLAGLGFEGTVASRLSPTEITVVLSSRPASGQLTMGSLEMLSGEANAMRFDILSHHIYGTQERLELWLPIHVGVAVGDAVCVTVGCDKTFATCRNQFGNQLNFRGFPHIPGNDFILSYPEQGLTRDGSAIVVEQ
ncbi:DUF2163 domain-containing protein [Cohaesibacter celericrescens]|uniref:DUF2163 domain-containing protein n=1 Tax=Cohaesibacter celericrescens TaxID=2067669 RepID=UPI003562858D